MAKDDQTYASIDIMTTASGRYQWSEIGRYQWAEIATFSTTSKSAYMEAVKWVDSRFAIGHDIALVMRNRQGDIVGSWNYDYEEGE